MATKRKTYGIVNSSDLLSQVEDLYERGLSRGMNTGWPGLDELITIKHGTTFYIYGAPFSGKTEWWLEILVNLSCLFGLRHAIYSPETGAANNIMAELISKIARKPFYKNVNGAITKEELYQHYAWIEHHFKIVEDSEGEMDVQGFFEEVKDYERNFGRIDTTTIDPFNELNNDLGLQRDLGMERILGLVRRNAIHTGRINCIITHVQQQQSVTENGITYYPKPSPREIAYGQAWYRKGMNMICVWRPPAGLTDKDGKLYEQNEVHIEIQKYKPKGIGNRGTHRMFYDVHKNSYFEYGGMHHQYSIRNRKDYQLETTNLLNANPDDLPF